MTFPSPPQHPANLQKEPRHIKKTAVFTTAVLSSSNEYRSVPSAGGAILCRMMFEEMFPVSEQFNDKQ
jgi:hypothetical protein